MSHEVEKMAYINEVPWHGLGSRLQPGADLLTWQTEAGLDWEAKSAFVQYDREQIIVPGFGPAVNRMTSKNDIVLYRSDTGAVLGIHSPRYKAVQPNQVVMFYKDLTEKYGFVMESAGCLKGGKRIWALANTQHTATLCAGDTLLAYLLLTTGYDGTLQTHVMFTNVRVVCWNTLGFALDEKSTRSISVPHSTVFDADKVKIELNIGDAWKRHVDVIHRMANTNVNKEESAHFLMDVYFGINTDKERERFKAEEGSEAKVERLTKRMTHALFGSPGSHLESAKGMLWGLLNAVTYDVDHTLPAHTQENRLNGAWFGKGAALKQRAWDKAVALVKV